MLPLVFASALAAPTVRFAAFGDVPYQDADIPKEDALLASFAGKGLAFAVHVGDIKSGGRPCDDALLRTRHDQLAQSPIPLLYTPGDNEWTDCHRAPLTPGGSPPDPLERLAFLRGLFYPSPAPLSVAAQDGYPENQRWTAGGVVFATLHVVGSNDGAGRTPAGDAEQAARRAADLAWLDAAVKAAQDAHAPLVVFEQADPWIPGKPAVFPAWRKALADAARELDAPMLFVHGDSHVARFDRPFLGVGNFWRLEVPGDGDVRAVVVDVDPAAKTPFVRSFLGG